MQLLVYVIAVLLSPFGEGCQKVIFKILACLDFMDFFCFRPKELADLGVLTMLEKHKWIAKIVGVCYLTILTGGLYLCWVAIKWSFKLFVKIFKFIFRRKRA